MADARKSEGRGRQAVRMYLGEELGPDGLNILDASGLDESLELVGLKIV